MQKIIIIFTFVILFTSSLMAGEFSGIGLKLGYNSSVFTGDDLPGKEVSSLAGLALGGFVSYKFNTKFSLRQEVLLTSKGARINTIGDVYLSNIFLYFELPLLAKMTFLSEQTLQPNIFIGPAFGLTIMAVNDVTVLEDIRGYDLGLVLGAGVDIWKLALDIRFNIGLLNFDQSAENLDLKNRTFSIMVGYAF